MNKIYGFKKSDVLDFLDYYKKSSTLNLTKLFNEYALITKKASGSIRNLYYAIVRKSNEDIDFCLEYLDGKPIGTRDIEAFSNDDEYQLIEKILINKAKGKSVRKIVNELANGDQKLALRYQNKYRNALKKKGDLIEEISKKLGLDPFHNDHGVKLADNRLIVKLEKEINVLVDKISLSIRKENQILRDKVRKLEVENTRLIKLLYSNQSGSSIKYFKDDVNALVN